MNKHLIQVAFAGDALDDGTMDIKALAPALLALGELVEEANLLLGKPGSKISVNVKSDFKTGSFEVAFQIVQSWIDQALGLLSLGDDPSSLEVLLKSIGFISTSGMTFFGVMKLIKGKPIKSYTAIDNGFMRIETTESFHEIKTTPGVIELCKSPTVRKAAKEMVKPLELSGIEEFQIRDKEQVIGSVGKQELPYFRYEQSTNEILTENTLEVWVEIISVCFEPHRKWQVEYGGSKIHVTVLDQMFLREVGNGDRSFSKGDRLRVELVMMQKDIDGNLRTEYEILHVLEQKKPPNQGKLF